MKKLNQLNRGESAIVASLSGEETVSMRLRETGFTPGTTVRMIMKTPFGDPVIYELRGTQIALRKEEALCINLE